MMKCEGVTLRTPITVVEGNYSTTFSTTSLTTAPGQQADAKTKSWNPITQWLNHYNIVHVYMSRKTTNYALIDQGNI